MKEDKANKHLEEMLHKVEEDRKIVKKFDFGSDIDWIRSDKCYVGLNNRYIEFLYKKKYEIEPNNYRVNIFGDFKPTNNGLQLIPQLSEKVNDSIKRSNVIVEKAIDPSEIDVIDIELETNEFSNVCIRFENQFFYDISKKVTKGELPLNNAHFESNESKRYSIFSYTEHINVSKSNGTALEDGGIIKTRNRYSSRKYIVNLKKGDIYIGNKNEKFHNNLLKIDEKCYLSIACNSITENTDLQVKAELYIKNIFYGKETGYLYFKPFTASEVGSAEMIFLYRGTPDLQYLDSNSGAWKSIAQNQTVDANGPINFRILMYSGDQIYEVIAVER